MKKLFTKSTKKGSWWNQATAKVLAAAITIIMIVTVFVVYNHNYSDYLTTSELQGSDLVFVVQSHELHWELEDGDKIIIGECSVTVKTHGSDDPTEWEIISYHPFCH